ncbi:hypothetical protein HEFE104084_07380 [Helicobacter felis]
MFFQSFSTILERLLILTLVLAPIIALISSISNTRSSSCLSLSLLKIAKSKFVSSAPSLPRETEFTSLWKVTYFSEAAWWVVGCCWVISWVSRGSCCWMGACVVISVAGDGVDIGCWFAVLGVRNFLGGAESGNW